MQRTARRPLPMGVVSPREALTFGIVLSVASIALLAATTTLLAAALAAGAIFYYAVLYTVVFKRHTRRSTEFGGIPGAAPVLIGWAAVTGSLAWPALVFFAVVFCWQMPHFWALAMRFREDYARAGVPMLPVVAVALSVGRQTVAWAWATVAVSLLLWPLARRATASAGSTRSSAAVLGGWFVVEAHKLLRRIQRDGETRPMQLFHVSISYLALLSVAIIVDAIDLTPRAPGPRQRADGPARRLRRPHLRAADAADRARRDRGADRVGLPGRHLLPGGRLVWHDEDDAWPAWADARSAPRR